MKTETIAEFLARGGVINKVPTGQATVKPDSVKSTSPTGPATLMTMEDADLYYGETRTKKTKKKAATTTIDLSALPPELREKYGKEVTNVDKEEDEED